MGFDLGNLLQQYVTAEHNVPAEQVENDFHQAMQHSSPDTVASGIGKALRSDETPPFASIVGQLFGQGDVQQRTGMINQLIHSLAPAVLSSIAGGAIGRMTSNGAPASQLTPDQVEQLSPREVNEIAATAEQQNPNIIDRMSQFYAQHPDLVKGIGAAGLAIALGHIAQKGQAS